MQYTQFTGYMVSLQGYLRPYAARLLYLHRPLFCLYFQSICISDLDVEDALAFFGNKIGKMDSRKEIHSM